VLVNRPAKSHSNYLQSLSSNRKRIKGATGYLGSYSKTASQAKFDSHALYIKSDVVSTYSACVDATNKVQATTNTSAVKATHTILVQHYTNVSDDILEQQFHNYDLPFRWFFNQGTTRRSERVVGKFY